MTDEHKPKDEDGIERFDPDKKPVKPADTGGGTGKPPPPPANP